MTPLFGQTRTAVSLRHALIAPDSHVGSAFPGWDGAAAYVQLSPAIGSELSQILVVYEKGGGMAWFPAGELEHAVYVERGDVRAVWDDGDVTLTEGGFLFVPPDNVLALHGSEDTRLTVFRKVYEPVEGIETPSAVHGYAEDVAAEAYGGEDKIRRRVLLPVEPRFDLGMDLFTCQPGAALPVVETHVMECGLQLLTGQGVCRLDQAYYPVQAGDAIWTAPYCPQWLVAMGDEPLSYLCCRDLHRLP